MEGVEKWKRRAVGSPQRLEVMTLFIEPGSPRGNVYVESFNEKLRDELLNGEIYETNLNARGVTK